MFLNKILSIKNWFEFPELKLLFSDQQNLDLKPTDYVGNVTKGMKKLSGYFSNYFNKSKANVPEVLQTDQSSELDDGLNSLRITFDDHLHVLGNII